MFVEKLTTTQAVKKINGQAEIERRGDQKKTNKKRQKGIVPLGEIERKKNVSKVRETQIDRERQRLRERERKRERDRHTDTQTKTDRHADRQAEM